MSHSRATNSRRRSTIWRWTCARERRRRSGRGGKSPTGPTAPDDALPRVPLQPDQEAVAEHDQNGVTMETLPQPTLVLIPAQQALGFMGGGWRGRTACVLKSLRFIVTARVALGVGMGAGAGSSKY